MLPTLSSSSVKIISLNRDQLLTRLRQIASRLQKEHPEVAEVRLFGSLARGDQTGTSDVDILIEYLRGHVPGFDFVAHQTGLSRLLARKVALNTPRCLGRRLRDAVQQRSLVRYEQP